jgi:hypothetical protein
MDNKSKKKNIVQDVIPSRRSIRSVELPSRKEKLAERFVAQKSSPRESLSEVAPKPTKKGITIKKSDTKASSSSNANEMSDHDMLNRGYDYEEDKDSHSSKKILYASVIIFIIALGFGISAFFRKAVITVTPKNESKNFEEKFVAKKEDSLGGLLFQTVVLTKEVEETVTATSEQKVSRKATGKVIVYNNYSSTPQKLVINTRLQTADGLVYRLTAPVSIPGKKVISGKTVAGSVEVSVIADATGSKYNIGLTDFTVPGFKGDPRYATVYARSKTTMSGGFEGVEKVVSPDIISQAEEAMDQMIKDYLAQEIGSQIPENYILYPTSISYVFGPVTQAGGTSTTTALLKKKGTATAIIFDKGSLTRVILSKVLQNTSDDIIKIPNLQTLTFAYTNEGSFNPTTSTTLEFVLSGTAQFEWVFDAQKLKADLLGLSKEKGMKVIGNQKAIKEAWIETRPFWSSTIPAKQESVTIVNTLEK